MTIQATWDTLSVWGLCTITRNIEVLFTRTTNDKNPAQDDWQPRTIRKGTEIKTLGKKREIGEVTYRLFFVNKAQNQERGFLLLKEEQLASLSSFSAREIMQRRKRKHR